MTSSARRGRVTGVIEGSEGITVAIADRIATVTIDRADKANALRQRDKLALASTINVLSDDASVDAVVLTGAGTRAFSAGSDLNEMQGFDADDMYQMLSAERAMYVSILESPKPIVAAVDGAAFGAGMILLMCCDYVIAAKNAQLGTPELTIGVTAPLEALILPWIVGLGRARAMFYRARRLSAREAEHVGLVHKVVAPGECLTASVECARKIAALPGSSFRLQKELLRMLIMSGSLEAAIEASHTATSAQFSEPTPGEAMRSFLQSRRQDRS